MGSAYAPNRSAPPSGQKNTTARGGRCGMIFPPLPGERTVCIAENGKKKNHEKKECLGERYYLSTILYYSESVKTL
jgi:hypothetical protein